jgi:hypothetical protein
MPGARALVNLAKWMRDVPLVQDKNISETAGGGDLIENH